jgi:hypothetical protein
MSAKTKVQAARPTLSRAAAARVVSSDETRPSACAHCGRLLQPPKPTGRPRRTCCKTCRNAAYNRRARGLPEDLPRTPHRGRRPLAGLVADIREVKR